jgi:hypothetical protein
MTGRSLTWPSLPRLAAGLLGALAVSVVFFPVYIGGATIAALSGDPLHVYASWELAIPFWPPMIVAYLSMFVLFLIPPLQLEPRELFDLAMRLVVSSLVGGVVFLCTPTMIGFAERDDAGIWQPLYDRVYAIDARYNAVPSFHVIYTASILLALFDVSGRRLRLVWVTWLVIVCASTVLTHRHHLVDVASGLAVALAVRSLARGRSRTAAASPEASQ